MLSAAAARAAPRGRGTGRRLVPAQRWRRAPRPAAGGGGGQGRSRHQRVEHAALETRRRRRRRHVRRGAPGHRAAQRRLVAGRVDGLDAEGELLARHQTGDGLRGRYGRAPDAVAGGRDQPARVAGHVVVDGARVVRRRSPRDAHRVLGRRSDPQVRRHRRRRLVGLPGTRRRSRRQCAGEYREGETRTNSHAKLHGRRPRAQRCRHTYYVRGPARDCELSPRGGAALAGRRAGAW